MTHPFFRPAGVRAMVGLGLMMVTLCGVLSAQDLSAQAVAPSGSSQTAPASAAQSKSRQKIGLALGGGAARGLAHIGLLRWFEEHRIPIDYIAGTSVGGLIGGGYASGLSPDEIQAVMKAIDWDLAFLSDSPYRYKTFRRKEDARAFPGQIDFGLRGGFTLPSGLNAGQQIELILDRIALPYYAVNDFDDLPTPFRCVATDIRKAEPIVFESGSLARALRATMAIPAVFTPVVVGEQVLVDGGTLNNIPADVVKAMGADVAIAVNVSSTTDPPAPASTLFTVLSQTIDAMMVSGTRSALQAADLLVVPDLQGLTALDWRKTDELVARGYAAGEAMAGQLMKYQVDEATYAAWKREREQRRRNAMPPVAGIIVEGVPPQEANDIASKLYHRHSGRPFASGDVEESILELSGSDRYEVISYTLRAGEKGADLILNVTPKSYGPPFVLPALDIQNIDSNSFAMSLRMRLVTYDTLVPNSEWRVDGGIGTTQSAAIELYKRVGRTGLFLAPRAYFQRTILNGYDDEGEQLAEYRLKRTGAGFDVGYSPGSNSEIRAGYDVQDVRVRLRVGTPVFPEAEGAEHVASVRWTYDGLNSPVIPSRGLRVQTAMRYFFETPPIVTDTETVLVHPRDIPQLEARASWVRRVFVKQRLIVGGSGGTSFGRDPGVEEFRLGGPLRLGAFNNGEIRGHHYALGVVGLLHEWFRLPDILGGNTYLGVWLEQGTAFNDASDADYRGVLTGSFIMETILGPAFIGYSQSATSGDSRFYMALAPIQF